MAFTPKAISPASKSTTCGVGPYSIVIRRSQPRMEANQVLNFTGGPYKHTNYRPKQRSCSRTRRGCASTGGGASGGLRVTAKRWSIWARANWAWTRSNSPAASDLPMTPIRAKGAKRHHLLKACPHQTPRSTKLIGGESTNDRTVRAEREIPCERRVYRGIGLYR